MKSNRYQERIVRFYKTLNLKNLKEWCKLSLSKIQSKLLKTDSGKRNTSQETNKRIDVFKPSHTLIVFSGICLISAVIAGGLAGKCSRNSLEQVTLQKDSVGDTLQFVTQRIRYCSKLCTSEYDIHRVIKCTNNYKKALIPIKITLKTYVDFSTFSKESIKKDGDNICITLTAPQIMITSEILDYSKLKEYGGDWTPNELQEAVNKEYDRIYSDIKDIKSNKIKGIQKTAEETAFRTMVPIMQKLKINENNLKIVFESEPEIKEIVQ